MSTFCSTTIAENESIIKSGNTTLSYMKSDEIT